MLKHYLLSFPNFPKFYPIINFIPIFLPNIAVLFLAHHVIILNNLKGYFITMYHCMCGSKGQAEIQLKCIPGKRDTTEMYVSWESYAHNWWINKPSIKRCSYSNPHCIVTVIRLTILH